MDIRDGASKGMINILQKSWPTTLSKIEINDGNLQKQWDVDVYCKCTY